jgi:hypothetical protein
LAGVALVWARFIAAGCFFAAGGDTIVKPPRSVPIAHVWSYDFVEDSTHDGRRMVKLSSPVWPNEFYRQRIGQHLEIGLKALEKTQSLGVGMPAFTQTPKLRRGRISVVFLKLAHIASECAFATARAFPTQSPQCNAC